MNTEFNPNKITQDYARQLSEHYKRINAKLGIKQDIKRSQDEFATFLADIVDCKPKPPPKPELKIVLSEAEKEFIKAGQLSITSSNNRTISIEDVLPKICAAYDTTYTEIKTIDKSTWGQTLRANIIQTLLVMYKGQIPSHRLAEVFQRDLSTILNMIAMFDIKYDLLVKNFSNIKCGYYSLKRRKKNMQDSQQIRVKRSVSRRTL